MRLQPRHAPLLFGLIVSGIMTCAVSGLSVALGMAPDFSGYLSRWLRAWATSWMIAFPLLTVIAPRVRALVARITAPS